MNETLTLRSHNAVFAQRGDEDDAERQLALYLYILCEIIIALRECALQRQSSSSMVSGCSIVLFASFYGDTTTTKDTAGYRRRSILLIGRFRLRDRPKCWC